MPDRIDCREIDQHRYRKKNTACYRSEGEEDVVFFERVRGSVVHQDYPLFVLEFQLVVFFTRFSANLGTVGEQVDSFISELKGQTKRWVSFFHGDSEGNVAFRHYVEVSWYIFYQGHYVVALFGDLVQVVQHRLQLSVLLLQQLFRILLRLI